ncbi:MAG: diguanylate cyclase [Chloroflexi bacterium]|nr:diguanylate cyclase [Chloroflexota bacterium]
MQKKKKPSGFIPQDNLISILPSAIAGMLILVIMVAEVLHSFPPENPLDQLIIILYGIIGILYLGFFYFIFTASPNKARFSWLTSMAAGLALGSLVYRLPKEMDYVLYTLLIIGSLSASVISSRGPAYSLVILYTTVHLFAQGRHHHPVYEWITHLCLTLAAMIGIETIQQLKAVSARQINRLEVVNELSQRIVSTLDTQEVFAVLNTVMQKALEADAYYIGVIEGDELHIILLCDDGEYFNNLRINKKGTLANWVSTHQQGLFLPDTRQPPEVEDVEIVTVGKKDRPTLSWMGVPMRGSHVDGVIAISSYQANAFARSDMELLSNIAQRAALALDNTHHHAQVEEQAQLDSLTHVYNHGYFIRALREQSRGCLENNHTLSLIMLDIDHFKQYNDNFGHLVGDEILIRLCGIIRSHIKHTDAIGRWGGEEFAISLPGTNEEQALRIAGRIRQEMAQLKMTNEKTETIPAPTVSQGIAIFPAETNDVAKLIDLADKRLYTAKERGRDQIEGSSASSR